MIDCDEQPGRPPDSTVCRDRRSRRPSTGGPRAGPRLTDAELLTLAVAQVLLGVNNEHRWMRLAYCRLAHLFATCPTSPAITSGSKRPHRCSPRRSPTWPGSARPGATSCAWSMPPRCRARPRGRQCSARNCPAGPVRLLCGALPLLLGTEAVPARRPRRDADRLVPGRPEARRTRGLPGPAERRRRDQRRRATHGAR